MENIGYVHHPVNKRRIVVKDRGTYEPDTNAYTSDDGYPIFEYESTGAAISWEELNQRHGESGYLHEWLWDNTEWE